jgi:hypothetical protein
MVRAVVFPIARLADLNVGERRMLRRRLLRLGEPEIERAGVVGRRICFTHDFYADDIDDLRELAQLLGMTLVQILEPKKPDNWREPVSTDPAFIVSAAQRQLYARREAARAASASRAAKPRAVRPAAVKSSPRSTPNTRGTDGRRGTP